MRLIYSDPLENLKALIEDALSSNNNVSHVSITKSDMRACLAHSDAPSVFDKFLNERGNRIARYEKQLEGLMTNTLPDADKIPIFNRQDELEDIIVKTKNEVPSKIILTNGVTVQVSLSA
jgi:hypothetical protein